MPLATYADLQTATANWLHRADLSSYIPDFISIAEARIGRDVRSRLQEQRVETTITATYESLPSDFLEMRSLWLVADPIVKLGYLSPDIFFTKYPNSTTGAPKKFTIFGDEMRFGPIADSNYTIELWYYKRLPALSSSVSTLFTSNPDLYLYATLCAATSFLKNDARVPMWESYYQRVLTHVNVNEASGRYPDSLQMVVA